MKKKKKKTYEQLFHMANLKHHKTNPFGSSSPSLAIAIEFTYFKIT